MTIEPTSTPLVVTWPATAQDVAVLLRARTQDSATGPDGSDVEVGTWTSTTRPTLDEVEQTLAMCEPLVLGQTGSLDALVCETADAVRSQAATAVALLAAMLIELSYFPEQVASNRSAYEQYAALWTALMPALVESVAECADGGVEPTPPGNEGAEYIAPSSWAFPVDTGGMVGWGTKW